MKINHVLFTLIVLPHILSGNLFFVAPDGDDAATGIESAPWKSPQWALQHLQPGDTLYFMGGDYDLDGPLTLPNNGTGSNWITLDAYPGEVPVLNFENYDLESWNPSVSPYYHDRGALYIYENAYIRVQNLTIIESPKMGINVRNSEHIEILNCRIDRTLSCGIGVWHSSWVRVIGNHVTRSSDKSRISTWNDWQDAPHESISTGGAWDFEIAWNHVHNGFKEGIDIKETSARGIVHHNYVHDMPRQGLYADAWYGLLEDIEFHHNIVHNCEWGIVVSAEGQPSEELPGGTMEDVSIHHNIVYNNRGSGFYFGLWNGDNERYRIDIYNNTFYNNGSVYHWSGPTGNIDLRSSNIFEVRVFNNLSAEGGAFEIASFAESGFTGLQQLLDQDILISHNTISTTQNSITRSYPDGYGDNHAYAGSSPRVGDPGWVNEAQAIFLLTPGSIAEDAGLPEYLGGYLDVDGSVADAGALFLGIENTPVSNPVFRRVSSNVVEVSLPMTPWMDYALQSSSDLENWTEFGSENGSWLQFRRVLVLPEAELYFVQYKVEPAW